MSLRIVQLFIILTFGTSLHADTSFAARDGKIRILGSCSGSENLIEAIKDFVRETVKGSQAKIHPKRVNLAFEVTRPVDEMEETKKAFGVELSEQAMYRYLIRENLKAKLKQKPYQGDRLPPQNVYEAFEGMAAKVGGQCDFYVPTRFVIWDPMSNPKLVLPGPKDDESQLQLALKGLSEERSLKGSHKSTIRKFLRLASQAEKKKK